MTNLNLNFKYENVIVGNVTDKGLVVMNIEQKQTGYGTYGLDVVFSHCSIEIEEQINIEGLVEEYVENARYDGRMAMQVLEWLHETGENVHDLPYAIQRDCDSDGDYKNDVLEVLGLSNPSQKFAEGHTLLTHEHSDGDVYHLVEIMPVGENNVFGIKAWSHVFPMVYSYANVFNEKTYDETVATQISELVKDINTDSELVFSEYVENKF